MRKSKFYQCQVVIHTLVSCSNMYAPARCAASGSPTNPPRIQFKYGGKIDYQDKEVRHDVIAYETRQRKSNDGTPLSIRRK